MSDGPWTKYQKQAGVKPWEKYATARISQALPDVQLSGGAAGGQEQSWSDLPGNVLPSAGRFVSGIAEAVAHPVRTANVMGDALGGVFQKGMDKSGLTALDEAITPQWWKDAPLISKPSKEVQDRQGATANALWSAAAKRYGGWDRAKQTMIQDPVGFLMDVSTVATGGAGLARMLPGKGAQTAARALQTTSEVTNPLNAITVPGGALLHKYRAAAPVKALDELQAAKTAAYADVKSSGVRYDSKAIDGLINNIDRTMARHSFNPVRHEKTMAFVPTLQQMRGSAPSLTELDQLRQVARRDVASASDAADAHFGKLIIDKIDQFTDRTSPKMLVSGQTADVKALLDRARSSNQAYRKTEAVQSALSKAEMNAGAAGSGANGDNAIRQAIKNLINAKSTNVKAWKPAERAQADRIVMGSPTRNTARYIGKLAPTGIVSGGAGAGIGAALGSFVGGPAGAAIGSTVVPGIGYLAKRAGDASTRRSVDDLLRLIQNNGKMPPAPPKARLTRDPGAAVLLNLLTHSATGR